MVHILNIKSDLNNWSWLQLVTNIKQLEIGYSKCFSVSHEIWQHYMLDKPYVRKGYRISLNKSALSNSSSPLLKNL